MIFIILLMTLIFIIAIAYKFLGKPITNQKAKSNLLLVITIFTLMIGMTFISFIFLIIYILTLDLSEEE